MELILAAGVLTAIAAAGVLRFRWLTTGGAVAAVAVALAVLAGAGAVGLCLLLLFFVSASALTRLGGAGRRRDADRAGRGPRQVLANGGVAAAAALLALLPGLSGVGPAVVGALAAATADTWASEVGTAIGGDTRLITTGRRVEPGRSGGVSLAGTLAGLAGALLIGLVAAGLGGVGGGVGEAVLGDAGRGVVGAALVAGAVGMALDSLLGATAERRYRVVDNDLVNVAGTLAGALVGWALHGGLPI